MLSDFNSPHSREFIALKRARWEADESDRFRMSVHAYIIAFAVGAAAIAAWIDTRFPKLAPTHLRLALAHVIGACVIANLVMATGLIGAGESPMRMTSGLLLVALPILVYEFLAGVWTIKVLQAAFRTHGR